MSSFSSPSPDTLHVDTNEPHEIFAAIGQTGTKFNIDPLNAAGHSDYAWLRFDGVLKEVERKTWGEVLQSVDKVEEQMLRHIRNFTEAEHVLLLEGMAVSTGSREAKIIRPAKGGSLYVPGHTYRQSMKGVYAWLYQMSHYITILPTMDRFMSSVALVAMFESDQKAEHKTLKRHIVVNDFHPDPVVTLIMRMLDGVGEKRALAIKEHFPTIYSLVTARPQELVMVEGIGGTLAKTFCERLGSPYA